MTPHIAAEKGQIAKTVLMPGDPLRAKYIAENFLVDAKLVSSIRNVYAYTGKYEGKEITVMASGMGNASIGIYSYELYKFYDVDHIIRIGTAGSYKKEIGLLEVVLAERSYSKSSYAKVQNGYDQDVIEASDKINNMIKAQAKENDITIHTGTVHSTDVFYGFYPEYEDYRIEDCIAVEMETFALFSNAKLLNKDAACILTVSNMMPPYHNERELTPEERQTSLNKMIVLALESGIKL